MSEEYRGPRVVPEMAAMDRHPLGWWVSIIGAGLVCWAVVFVAAWLVLRR